MRFFLHAVGVVSIILSMGMVGCNDKGEDGDVVIVVAGPISGSGAAFGEEMKNAANLKAKEVNDAGGIHGKRLVLRFEDDKGEAAEATSVARKVAADKDVCLVVGHFNSACTIAAQREYDRKGIVEFSPASTNVKVCETSSWTFRNLYRDDYQGTFLAKFAQKKLGMKKVAIIYDNDDYGKGLMNAFVKEAGQIGLTISGRESFIRDRTQDFKPKIQNLKSTSPDGIFVAGLFNEGALCCKTARTDLGMDIPFLGGDGLLNAKFIEIAGKAGEGAYITTPFLFNTGKDTDLAKTFLQTYQKAYSTDPGTWAALTYDAVGMAVEAIKAVGTDRKKLRDWFAACTTAEKGYTGVTGLTFFDDKGDCYSKGAVVAMVQDGRFVPSPIQLSVDDK